MASIDDVLAAATPRQDTITLSLRSDLARRHDELEALLDAEVDDERQLSLAEQIKAVEAEIRAASIEFVIVALGRRRWTELLLQHPPTDADRETYGWRIEWNPATFPYAAIAASVTEPAGLTEEKARELEDMLTVSEWQRLWNKVLVVNIGDRAPGESLAASVVLRRLRPSSEQPETTAPAAASSSAA